MPTGPDLCQLGREQKGFYTIGTTAAVALAEARRQAKEILELARGGLSPVVELRRRAEEAPAEAVRRAGLTVIGVVERHLEARRATLRPATLSQHEYTIKTLRESPLAARQLQELKRGDERESLRAISRERGPGSARKVKTLVRAAARWAAAEDVVPHDVLAGLSMPEIESRRRDRVLSDEEIVALWRACDDAPPIMAASVRLQLLLALRHPSETAGMRWTDLHRNRIDQPRANCGNATVAPSSYPPPPRQALRRASGLAYVFALSEDTYMSKLTLSVDDDVVRRAKRYAAKRATSLSQLVERYLDLLSSRPQKAGKQDPPVLRMLRGAARGVKVEDYRRHVVEKYR